MAAKTNLKPAERLVPGDVLIGIDGLPFITVARVEVQSDGLVVASDHSGHKRSQYPAGELAEVA